MQTALPEERKLIFVAGAIAKINPESAALCSQAVRVHSSRACPIHLCLHLPLGSRKYQGRSQGAAPQRGDGRSLFDGHLRSFDKGLTKSEAFANIRSSSSQLLFFPSLPWLVSSKGNMQPKSSPSCPCAVFLCPLVKHGHNTKLGNLLRHSPISAAAQNKL